MVVQHNLSADNASRVIGITTEKAQKNTEKLSSGYRINRSADDAAGLSISEKMRRQIRGIDRASANAQDGVSIVQTADGAMQEVQSMLQRGNELAVQAANGTNSDTDREYIQKEIDQLKTEIDRIAEATVFNETRLFPADGTVPVTEFPAPEHVERSFELKFDASGNLTGIDRSSGIGGSGSNNDIAALAEKIATEYVPNAMSQIMTAFPAFQNVPYSDYTMDLKIQSIDGASNTLAYVSGSFYVASQKLASLGLVVDKDDFNAASMDPNSSRVAVLESTLAHELMHGVMDAALSPGMYRNASSPSADDFPNWFVEGTAQLAGGGFTTGWNNQLIYLTSQYKNNIINSGQYETGIKQYLSQGGDYTVENRVYGHGYLAAAYLGHLASGQSTVSAQSIADGMNTIFSTLMSRWQTAPYAGFESVVNGLLNGSGKNLAGIVNEINGGAADAVNFVKDLLIGSYDDTNHQMGAGSVITTSLTATGAAILGNTATDTKFKFNNPYHYDSSNNSGSGSGNGGGTNWGFPLNSATRNTKSFSLHVGADASDPNSMHVNLFSLSSKSLGLLPANVMSQDGALDAIDIMGDALHFVSGIRGYYGALQNRLEHTIYNLDNVSENTNAAESRISDTDMAEAMVMYSATNIMIQAGQSVLAQANQQEQGALSLLG